MLCLCLLTAGCVRTVISGDDPDVLVPTATGDPSRDQLVVNLPWMEMPIPRILVDNQPIMAERVSALESDGSTSYIIRTRGGQTASLRVTTNVISDKEMEFAYQILRLPAGCTLDVPVALAPIGRRGAITISVNGAPFHAPPSTDVAIVNLARDGRTIIRATRVPTPATPLAAASTPTAAAPPAHNALSKEERAQGWTLLFDGARADTHLRGFKKPDLPSAWVVEDGCLVLRGQGGDLITRDQYEHFDFQVDWNVAPGGNSGIMWHVTEDTNYPWETGPEMQILDDAAHHDGGDRLTSAGACYALYAAPEGVVKPAGEWNTARIVCVGSKITLYLNGVAVVQYDKESQDYKDRLKKSKFAGMPLFDTKPKGHIALQDHGDVVKFRNIKVRPLDAQGRPLQPQG